MCNRLFLPLPLAVSRVSTVAGCAGFLSLPNEALDVIADTTMGSVAGGARRLAAASCSESGQSGRTAAAAAAASIAGVPGAARGKMLQALIRALERSGVGADGHCAPAPPQKPRSRDWRQTGGR